MGKRPGVMRFIAAISLAASVGATAFAQEASSSRPLSDELRRVIASARDKVFPALVNIRVITVSYGGGQESKGGSTGSGSIISADGYVVTNQHVVDNGKTFRCTLADKSEIPATLVGEDPLTDLAVLKLDLTALNGKPLPGTAEWSDSGKLQVGDSVMAMGSPLSLSRSVTLGIVSNTARVFTSGFGSEDVEDISFEPGQITGTFTRWIQHDALINPGNSGGPLVDMEGRIVGINAMGGNGIGFAIPSSLAREVAAAIVKDGEVKRSWIGVSFKPISNTGIDRGVLVNSVVADGPAAKAGVKAGDVIVKINGQDVTTRFAEEVPPLMKLVADQPIGSTIKLDLVRDTSPVEASVVTEKLLKDLGDQNLLRGWGISIREITEKMARDFRLDSKDGVLVTGARSGSPARLAEPQLDFGDIIHAVDHKPIKNISELIEYYKELMKPEKLPEFVLVEFERNGRSFVTLLKPRPDKQEDPPREVPKAWLGVATQPVLSDLAKQLGHEGQRGFRITRVYPGTTAAAALKVGDVITAVNGKKIAPRSMQESGALDREIRTLKADQSAKLAVIREGQNLELDVPLEATRLAAEEARRDQNKDFELTVREVTFFDRDEERWSDSVQGVVVASAERLGWAGSAGIRPGDLIQRIGSSTITDIESYRKVMQKLAQEQPERVVFVVLRDNRTFFNFAEPKWKPK